MLEESFERLNKEQCDAYLKRLGLLWPQNLSLEFLDQLLRVHLEKIPFENLDLVNTHQTVSTDIEQVYEKVVLRRRGGYCFELNGLFLALLRGLGYQAYPVACRVLKRPGLRMPTHRASVVCLNEKKYFCDVGYGGIACTRAALFESGASTETEAGSFYFEREYFGWLNFWYKSEKDEEKEPVKIFMVSELPSAPVDFTQANEAMCREDSIFYNHLVVQRVTPYGSVSIDGDLFTVRDKHGKRVLKIQSEKELRDILQKEFDL